MQLQCLLHMSRSDNTSRWWGVGKLFFKSTTPGSEICRCCTTERASDANILLRFLARNVCGWNTKVLLHSLCPSWIMWRVEGCCGFASSCSLTPLLSFVGAFLNRWSDRDIAVPLHAAALAQAIPRFFASQYPVGAQMSSYVEICNQTTKDK